MLKKINQERLILFKNIYNTKIEERDNSYLKDFQTLLPNELLFSYEDAIKNSTIIKSFIDELQNENIDAFVGGSFGLWCTYKKTNNFEPNDIDLYIKNINKNNLITIEKIIKKLFKENTFIVIRSPITMTWHIQLPNKIFTIQIMIMKIFAWSEILITYHSDITCIGFETLTNKFLFLKGRWENVLLDKVHYFSNVLNLDSGYGLIKASIKYKNRNFKCDVINVMNFEDGEFIKNNYGMQIFNAKQINTNNPKKENVSISSLLFNKYKYIENINYAKSVNYLFLNNEFIPPILYLSVFYIRRSKISIPQQFIEYFKKPQVLFYENDFYAIKIDCLECNKTFLLKTFMNNSSICCHITEKIISDSMARN